MAKKTEKQKTKEKETNNAAQPTINDVINKKITDVSRENGETTFHFSNGMTVKLKGYSDIIVKRGKE